MRRFATAMTMFDHDIPMVEIRELVMGSVIDELQSEKNLTPIELLRQLVPYANCLGNPKFRRWATQNIRYRIGSEFISKELMKELERRGVAVETVTPSIEEIKSAFRFVAESESKTQSKTFGSPKPREPKAVRELRALGFSEAQIAKVFNK